MPKIEKLNDESLNAVAGGKMNFTFTKATAIVSAPTFAGMGACAGITFGTLNGAREAKKYAEEKNMTLTKKIATIAAGAVAGFIGGGVSGAIIGATSGASVGAGIGMSTDITLNKVRS